jgi:phosphopantothenoylcysteine decarboxylase/phosphopantothenate--cysteine ligase
MEHISWARWADGLVVAPATANLLAKMATGLADDAASTLLLAYTGPVWVAPAMNTAMLEHPATVGNLEVLRVRGVRVIESGAGRLACGEVGAGRMAEPEDIVNVLALGLVEASSGKEQTLAGKRVLVTSGPTREMLDPIRFISNRSSGRMGTALAAEAAARGAAVTLIHGPMSAPVPEGVQAVPVVGARQMLAEVQRCWAAQDFAVFAAAVANYESAEQSEHKIKAGDSLTITLQRTPDIAAWAGQNRRNGQLLIGFAAESQDLVKAAQRKLQTKNLDIICANAIGEAGIGFEADSNQVILLTRDGRRVDSPRLPKRQVAGWIWDQVQSWSER